MFPLPVTRVLSVLTAFAVSIAAQDAETTVLPFPGNVSTLESPGKTEAAPRPDITRSSELVAYPTVPANYFLPGNNSSERSSVRSSKREEPETEES